MFYCQHTGELVGSRIPQQRVVTERRKKAYHNIIKRGTRTETKDTEGWEIVKEISVSPDAYRILTGQEPISTGKTATALNIVNKDTNSRLIEPWKFNRKKNFNSGRGDRKETPRGKKSPVVEFVSKISR